MPGLPAKGYKNKLKISGAIVIIIKIERSIRIAIANETISLKTKKF